MERFSQGYKSNGDAGYDDEERRMARRIDRHRKLKEGERMATAMKAQTMAPKSGVDVLSDQRNELPRKPVTMVVAAKVRAPDRAIFQPGAGGGMQKSGTSGEHFRA